MEVEKKTNRGITREQMKVEEGQMKLGEETDKVTKEERRPMEG